MKPKIFNAKGELIVLNAQEELNAQYWERVIRNSLGYEIPITTLTTIVKKVSEQKFYQVAPADYMPVRVGEGAWSSNLTTYRSYTLGGQFEDGILDTGANNARLASGDAGVDSLNIKVYNWAKSIGWTIMDIQQAAKAGNWDIVSAKEAQRKKNWDLGIERVAFLGARGNNSSGGACLGLLNQGGITVNTALITQAIKAMNPATLNTFLEGVLSAYRVNCNFTAWPTHFIIPETDYTGLAAPSSSDFPLKSKLELILETFKVMTMNPNFKVLPLAYCDAARSGFSYQQYVLLNYDDASVRMDIPVDYTPTLANSLDSFSFQNAAYGQFTGVLAYRPLEMLYFQYTP